MILSGLLFVLGTFQFINMSSVNYLTEEGLRKLQEEVNFLKNIERPRISQMISEARDKGDLSENAEYDAAKDAQGMLELKILKLEELLANSRVVDGSKLDNSKVLILSTVKLKNMDSKQEVVYTLVSEQEADLKSGKISVGSPIGKGLLGKSVGEVAEIHVPSGKMQFKVLEIKR
jgi:transcription elongation factor GreA